MRWPLLSQLACILARLEAAGVDTMDTAASPKFFYDDDADFRMPWFSRFEVPIKPVGRLPLRTLAEARGFIRQLPPSEQARVDWISAAALLAEAADRGEPHVSIARAAIERALRRSVTSSSGQR